MTLLQFILKLRRRLQDLRSLAGATIEDLNADGMRWATQELVDVTNDSLIELTRLVRTYSSLPILKQITDMHTIAKGTLVITSGMSAALDVTVLTVSELTDASNISYGYIKPTVYYDYLGDPASPRVGEKFFTMLRETDGSRKIYIMPSASFTANTTYVYAKSNYLKADAALALGFNGLEDLLLDIAERECRDREHNWNRSQILDNRIAIKLGIQIK
ncbi:MAG: hypothetical protein WC974_08915 [Thermoplasmata archaeon]